MSFLHEYGLFLAETTTVVLAVGAVVAILAAALSRVTRRRSRPGRPGLHVRDLGRRYQDLAAELSRQLMPAKAAKVAAKASAKERKAQASAAPSQRPRVFVLDFHGDLRATQVKGLREEITAVVCVARPGDEVLVRLSNPGGTVNDQGFAAAQLQRVRSRGIRLTVAVDTMAASGGYMMACVADRILAAPFAVIGSIGVVAQVPNVHRLMDRSGVDYEQFTGGRYKRTVTPFTRTTDEARAKLTEQIDETHALFKEFVASQRPGLDVELVATGEFWYGSKALELGLVDELITSDDYLLSRRDEAALFEVSYPGGRSAARRLGSLLESAAHRLSRPGPV